MSKEHYVLNERYRPSTLDGYVCEDYFKDKIDKWIKEENIPHLFFYGKPGSGKTTLAKIIVKNIDCDYLFLNAMDKRGMDAIKEEIIPFVSTMSFKSSPKIVILDEATHILPASQVLLLNMIETYSQNTRFILTGNYPERLIEPLRSRLEDYNLKPPSLKKVAKHIVGILDSEKIEYDLKELAPIIKTFYPDLRRIINTCQKYIINGKLTPPQSLTNDIDNENKIVDLLKRPDKNTFKTIRTIIAEGNMSDFDGLYKRLYADVSKYSKGNDGIITIIINEHLFQSNSVLDKEICFCACIAKIIEAIKPRLIS